MSAKKKRSEGSGKSGLENAPPGRRVDHFWVFIALFALSGFSGLVYEVVWSRMLQLVFGSTTYAISSVLGVFFFGLALGSYAAGKLIHRISNLIACYAWIEIGIGIYAAFFLIIMDGVQAAHSAIFPAVFDQPVLLNLARILLSFVLLLPPTAMMGATIPILGRAMTRSPRFVGADVGALYAFNTFGAMLGSFLSAFMLIPLFGLNVTIAAAAGINLFIGGFVLRGPMDLAAPHTVSARRPEINSKKTGGVSSGQARAVLVAFLLSGFLALVYEVAWSRALILVFGTSVYAFATMLTTYLAGIALGSLCMGRVVDRLKNPFLIFCIVQGVIGLSIFATTPIIGKLPYFFINLFEVDTSWARITFTEFSVCFFIMIVPAFSSGLLFPLVTRLLMHQRGFKIGRTIADAYTFNTFGSIIGSFAAGFLLIPLIGIEKTLLGGGATNLLLTASLITFSQGMPRRIQVACFGLLTLSGLAAYVFLPSWNALAMNAGVYVYSDRLKGMENQLASFVEKYKMLFYREGPSATVAVLESDKGRFLRINGKTDGGDVMGGNNDIFTQKLLGMVPLVYNNRPENALVVGVGTGMTIGAVLDHPDVKVDCIEISPSVVEASHYFDHVNGHAVGSSRTQTYVLDGRTWLMAMPNTYDIIVSEPSHPWQTGNANLFTADFFTLASEKLKKNGVFCQWMPYYRMENEHFKILVNSFKAVFAHVNAWIVYTDVILIGSNDPLAIDYSAIEAFIATPAVKSSLSAMGIDSLPELLSFFYLDTAAVEKLVKNTALLNTDNDPVIEFSAPKYLLAYQKAEAFYEMFELSFGSKAPLARPTEGYGLERDRVRERIKYYRKWGIPSHVINLMKDRYSIYP